MPLLALLERGAGNPPGKATFMKETPHEFEFWDRYFRLNDGDEVKPYFNPVTLRRAEAGFPHSNSATIRKNTFAGKWHAATKVDAENGETWTLAEDYADIVRDKILSKGADLSRAPALDFAVLMFRNELFDDGADAGVLETRFRQTFPQREDDYDKIFFYRPENANEIFDDASVEQDYESAIKAALVDDLKSVAGLAPAEMHSIEMDVDDPVLTQVQQLLALGTSGIIFTGAPGTGKSHYAKRVAKHLVTDVEADVFKVQFHPSYGYEDFVEGYRPSEDAKSGYQIVDKTFIHACRRAEELRGKSRLVVLVVDEINRGDPARVFGELLTYIERTYRGESFVLPFSGRQFSIPSNLVLLCTMNPYDRSVAQVDAAFVRRFDHIEVAPSREVVEDFLEANGGFSPAQVNEIGEWFDSVQQMVPFGLGHSFFADVRGLSDLKLVWRYRIRPTAVHAIELNDGAIDHLTASFDALVRRLEGAVENG